MAASSGFIEAQGVFHWAMRPALHLQITMAIEIASV
jgi:hypothetical protein